MNNIWIKFLIGILKMPGAKINRVSFLRKTFKGLPQEKMKLCIDESPTKVVPYDMIEKKANSIINAHATKATAISTVAGIPGGFTMLASIPADLANYYFHVVAVGQKLGYLYGFPDMVDNCGNLTEDGKIMLTGFIGVMNKVEMANDLIKKIAIEVGKRISEETASRVAGNILSKQIVAHSVEVIAKKLGVQITTKTTSRAVTKAVPIVSGLICGGITYASFKQQAKRLHQSLKDITMENNHLSKLSSKMYCRH